MVRSEYVATREESLLLIIDFQQAMLKSIDLLKQAGAVISSTEIVIFQWALRANTDDFRKILPIVK